MKSNRNEPNFSKFFEREEARRKKARAARKKAEQDRKIQNTAEYIQTLPDELKDANFSKWPSSLKARFQKLKFEENLDKYLIISSSASAYGMNIAQSIVIRFIAAGLIRPSQVRTTTLFEGYDNINGNFESRAWKDYFFRGDPKIFVIDGASAGMSRLEHRDEERFWREVDEFAKVNGIMVIVIYNRDETDRVSTGVTIPTLSRFEKLNKNIIFNSLILSLTEEEERMIGNE